MNSIYTYFTQAELALSAYASLTAGTPVTVEIKTGKRRVIEYFLSPLLQYKDESLRER